MDGAIQYFLSYSNLSMTLIRLEVPWSLEFYIDGKVEKINKILWGGNFVF